MKQVTVNDRMQRGYVYFLTEAEGENFDPEFRPQLTPSELLKIGVFGDAAGALSLKPAYFESLLERGDHAGVLARDPARHCLGQDARRVRDHVVRF